MANDQDQNAEPANYTQQPTITLSPDGEVYVSTEKEDRVPGVLPEVSTTVPDRDIVLRVPVWLLGEIKVAMSPGGPTSDK